MEDKALLGALPSPKEAVGTEVTVRLRSGVGAAVPTGRGSPSSPAS